MAVRQGNNENNQLRGTEERDTLIGEEGNDILFGLDEADVLRGGAGNDTLNGGEGRNRLDGGAGNDVYIVDNSSSYDRIVENSSGGMDTVRVTNGLGFELDNNIENLIMGSRLEYGEGNARDNNIRGNNSRNILEGKGGKDRLNGRGGNDQLQGGNGNDTLTGGNGNDQFVCTARRAFAAAAMEQDTLVDFTKGADRITLSSRTFGLTSIAGDSFSVATEFASVADQAAAEASAALIVFNRANNTLIYNQNGAAAGLGTGGTFATIANAAAIDATDFTVS